MQARNNAGRLPHQGGLIGMARREVLAVLSGGVILCIVALAAVNVRAADMVRVFVDGREIVSDVPAQIIEGRTMVPIRFVAEAMGAEVSWDDNLHAVSIITDRSLEDKAYMDWLERWGKAIEENSKLQKQLAPTRLGDPQVIALLRQQSANLEDILALARTIRPPKDAVTYFHETCEQILLVKTAIDLMIRSHEEALRGNTPGALALPSAAGEIVPEGSVRDDTNTGRPTIAPTVEPQKGEIIPAMTEAQRHEIRKSAEVARANIRSQAEVARAQIESDYQASRLALDREKTELIKQWDEYFNSRGLLQSGIRDQKIQEIEAYYGYQYGVLEEQRRTKLEQLDAWEKEQLQGIDQWEKEILQQLGR